MKLTISIFIRLSFFFVLCSHCNDVFAQYRQTQERINLYYFELNNHQLISIIDSFLSEEKYCDYYSRKTLFEINTRKTEKYYLVSISSLVDSNVVFGQSTYGYNCHHSHLFVLNGDICEELFTATSLSKTFNYTGYEYDSTISVKSTDDLVIPFFNDDSHTSWHYWYIDSNFLLDDKTPPCNERK